MRNIHVPPAGSTKHALSGGFTLIELSIVLVIIGLIVGGVLVGQSLINAAAVRAQISQIEKYNTAANTFYDKYGGLPGDLPANLATQFGFTQRGTTEGQGDGNGIIEGANGLLYCGCYEAQGETVTFWLDLATAHLLARNAGYGAETFGPGYYITETTPVTISGMIPPASIGTGNYVYVWSGGTSGGDAKNYFSVSGMSTLTFNLAPFTGPGLTVHQALNVDSKIDDGFPQSGNVTAMYLNGNLSGNHGVWAAGGGVAGASPGTAAAGSSTTCYDNGANASNPMQYSVEISSGSNMNCALSFKLRAGD